jgi:polyhydroxybutyrate depolymerase
MAGSSQVALLLLLLTSSIAIAQDAPLPSPPMPGRFSVTITSGDYERVAHVQIPKGYSMEAPPALVLALHGAGGNGRIILDHNSWAAKAEKNGFLVVAPDGLPARPREPVNFATNPALWNSGQLNNRSPRAAIDDVAYIRDLLDMLKDRLPYDTNRVYCCGHSNGGGMTFKLAAELSDRFQAVGAVAGLLAVADPQPKHPLPTLCILGTKDPLVPLEGGEVRLPWGNKRNPPVAEPLTAWAKAIGCELEPKVISDQDGIKKEEYPSKSNGPVLTVLMLKGQGHQWPGSKSFAPLAAMGPNTTTLNATDTLWDFFSSTAKPPAK